MARRAPSTVAQLALRGVEASPVRELAPAVRANPWAGRRVTLMGLGRHGGGVSAARFLAAQGARLTISDSADHASLAESVRQLADVPIEAVKLGGHDAADFRDAEFVVVNPAVAPRHACLQIARRAGARLTSEIEIFLQNCQARVIGVTGSNGKSTTCSMLCAALTAGGLRTWLGGNIGRSLLGGLQQIMAEDWVVLELSSFPVGPSRCRRGPPCLQSPWLRICAPNHLDWHGSFEAYALAKQRIFSRESRSPPGLTVLNTADPQVAGWAHRGRRPDPCALAFDRVGPLAVPGQHNLANAACAAAVAEAGGVDDATIRRALRSFTGLEHRLQHVAEIAGRRFYNDSKSTTPQATLAALTAIPGPVWLLAGGHSKGAQFDALASAIVLATRGAGLFGAARQELHACIASQDASFNAHSTDQLADALAWCWRSSRPGDAILLSPACASYDQFADFEARGETFRQLVRAIAAR